jgi:hypothetical protein
MTNRTDPEKHRAQVRAANRARYRAVQDLITAHPTEYDRLYAHHASAEGVTPSPRGRIDADVIASQIAELQARLNEMRSVSSDSA